MHRWRRALFALPALLAACTLPLGGLNLGRGGQEAPAQALAPGTDVAIRGPQGFCVDDRASQGGPVASFVLLGNCAAISGRAGAPQPDTPAVLTALVGPSGEGPGVGASLAALERFLRSEAGHAALARNGDGQSVEILESFERDSIFFIRVSEERPGAPRREQWRAFLDVRARLVSLGVMELAGGTMSGPEGRALIQAFAALVRAANETPPKAAAA